MRKYQQLSVDRTFEVFDCRRQKRRVESDLEQALVKATTDMDWNELVLTGLAIFTFDLSFVKSIYFEVNQNFVFKTWCFV